MKSLIWKQWREAKIQFWIFIAWMILAVCYVIAYELGHHYRAAIGSFGSLAGLYSWVAAIALAASAARGEQAHGTLMFTKTLPISVQRMATVRIASAMVVLTVPILVAAVILAAALTLGLIEQAEPRLAAGDYIQMPMRPAATLFSSLEQLASVTAILVLSGIQLLLILSLCGCWLHSQAQVGFLGAVMALASLIAAGLLWSDAPRWALGQLVYGIVHPQSLIIYWGYGDATGSYSDHELAQLRWPALALSLPFLAIIARCFIVRYGKVPFQRSMSTPPRMGFSLPSLLSFIALPLPARWLALVWLELRQALPLAFYGLMFAILLTLGSSITQPADRHDLVMAVRRELPHTVFFVGMLWAAVVGSGLVSAELGSSLGGFRRSRPIPHSMWFWIKFVVGLAAVLLVLDGVTILITWNASHGDTFDGMSYAYIACFPITHMFMYSLAVLGACLFRRALAGSVFAILTFALASMLVGSSAATMPLDPVQVYNNLLQAERTGHLDFTAHSYPLVYGFLSITAVICSIAASVLARWSRPPLTLRQWSHALFS